MAFHKLPDSVQRVRNPDSADAPPTGAKPRSLANQWLVLEPNRIEKRFADGIKSTALFISLLALALLLGLQSLGPLVPILIERRRA